MSKNATPKGPEKQFPGQHDDEIVEIVFHQHPLVMRKALIGGLFIIVFAVLPFDFPQIYNVEWLPRILMYLMLGIVGFVFLMWFYRWVGWYYTVFIVTNQRILVIKQRGLFNRKVDEWQLDGISNVNYSIGGFQAVLFGYGDIVARTYIGDLEMKTIHKPAEIHAQLVNAVRQAGGGSTQPSN
jgi:uncharacterized membrane protein YdbT with pleckstrin-like domain